MPPLLGQEGGHSCVCAALCSSRARRLRARLLTVTQECWKSFRVRLSCIDAEGRRERCGGAPPAPVAPCRGCAVSVLPSRLVGPPCSQKQKSKLVGGQGCTAAFALFHQARHHYPLCSQKAMWPPILGQCTSPGLAERALLCSAWAQSFAH